MNTVGDWLAHPQIVRAGWTLVHFVWQGVLLAAVWAGLRQALGRKPAQTRYLAGCLILFLMALAPMMTWWTLQPAPGSPVPRAEATSSLNAIAATVGSPGGVLSGSSLGGPSMAWVDRVSRGADVVMPGLVGLWLIGVMGLSLRIAAGWHQVIRFRRRGTAVTEAWLQDRLETLRQRMGVSRPIRLLKSVWIEVPTVVGWLHPVILLPCSSLIGLSPQQLELLLAHELAHIRRHDHWVNLAQVLIETLLFYHPAVWWVSRDIREEREHCCDDLAVEVCGDRRAYVEALASMEALRQLAPQLTMGASGGSLLARVRRLLRLAPEKRDRCRAAGGTLVMVGLLAVLLAGVGWTISPIRYEAVARIVIEPLEPNPYRTADVARPLDVEAMATHLELLRSRSLLETVVRKEKLNERWYGIRDVPEWLQSRITVRRIPPSGMVEVIVSDEEPSKAASIANTLVNEFIEQNIVQKQKKTLDLLFFLKSQANGLERDVAKAEDDMMNYQRSVRFASFAKEQNGVGQALNATIAKHAEAKSKAETARSTTEEMARHLTNGKPLATFPPVAVDPALRQVQLDLVRLETELSVSLLSQGENHPSVQQARARIEATRAAADRIARDVAATLEAEVGLAKATEQAQASLVKEWEDRQGQWSRAKTKYDVLESKANSSKALFNLVLEKMKESDLVQKDKANNVRVSDYAYPPENAVYALRKPALILFGAGLLAGVLGLGLRGSRTRFAESDSLPVRAE